MIQAISAVSGNGCIGRNNTIPWHYPEDLRFFYETTQGKAVVMGRKTFDSLKKPLRERNNFVLTHREIGCAHLTIIKNPEPIINLTQDCFIIGGLSVWQMFKSNITRWYISKIPGEYEGDTFFDYSLLDNFSLVEKINLGNGIIVNVFTKEVIRSKIGF